MSSLHRQKPERPPPTRRIPPPLAALLAVVLLFGVAWTLVVPPWQAPDENNHFAYAQTLAERFALPGDASREMQSTEQRLAAEVTEADQVAAIPQGRPAWTLEAERRWERQARELSRAERVDGGGPNPAASNPPLYYLYAAGAYRLAYEGDIFDRLYVQRTAGLVWLLVTVAAAWLLAGEVLGRRSGLQLTAAAVAGLVPMVSFVSASVSPDGMLYALWSLALWLGARVLRRGLTLATATAFSAVVVAAILVKATSYALLPAASFALPLLLWWAAAADSGRGGAEQVSATSTELGFERLRHFFSYLWQFYLPRAPWQNDVGGFGVWEYWIKGAFGRFGWLEVLLPVWVYAVVAMVAVLVTIGLASLVVRARLRLDWPLVVFFGLAAGALLAGLHWTDFGFRVDGLPFMQGRYLLPLIALGGLAVAAALTAVPRRRRTPLAGALIAGLVLAQLLSLGANLTRFYA